MTQVFPWSLEYIRIYVCMSHVQRSYGVRFKFTVGKLGPYESTFGDGSSTFFIGKFLSGNAVSQHKKTVCFITAVLKHQICHSYRDQK